MGNLTSLYSQWSPRFLSVLRIVTAFLFMQHGGQKLFGFPAPAHGAHPLLSLMGVAGFWNSSVGCSCCWGCSPGR